MEEETSGSAGGVDGFFGALVNAGSAFGNTLLQIELFRSQQEAAQTAAQTAGNSATTPVNTPATTGTGAGTGFLPGNNTLIVVGVAAVVVLVLLVVLTRGN